MEAEATYTLVGTGVHSKVYGSKTKAAFAFMVRMHSVSATDSQNVSDQTLFMHIVFALNTMVQNMISRSLFLSDSCLLKIDQNC